MQNCQPATDETPFITIENPTEIFEICFRNEKGYFGMAVATVHIPEKILEGYKRPLELTVRAKDRPCAQLSQKHSNP